MLFPGACPGKRLHLSLKMGPHSDSRKHLGTNLTQITIRRRISSFQEEKPWRRPWGALDTSGHLSQAVASAAGEAGYCQLLLDGLSSPNLV